MENDKSRIKRLKEWIDRYDAAIWVRFWGTVLTSVTTFMLRPFLVLYLYDKMNGSILLPMVVVGLQPLTGMVVSLWGGGLSDRYGRMPVMLSALAIQAASMAGYMFAETVWHFAFLTILNGLGAALFFPAASAQVADVVEEEKTAEVFALLHTGVNIGTAVGPLIGLALFTHSPALVFGISAVSLLLYTVMLWWKVPETLPVELKGSNKKAKVQRLAVREHKTLLWITILALPVGLLYSQVETLLPLHLKANFADYQAILAWLLAINGTAIILLQMWLAKRTEHLAARNVILFAYLTMVVVALGYGLAPTFALLILVEIIFTIGEMLFGPHMQKSISVLAPIEMRGRYFSIYGLNLQLARAIGPVLSGLSFAHFGGEITFGIIGMLLLLSGIVQYRVINSIYHKRKQAAALSPQAGSCA